MLFAQLTGRNHQSMVIGIVRNNDERLVRERVTYLSTADTWSLDFHAVDQTDLLQLARA